MPRIAYITGTFPAWSETFIAQELDLLLACSDLSVKPVAIWQGEGEGGGVDMTYLYPRGKGGKGPRGGVGAESSGPNHFSPPVARRISMLRHRAAFRTFLAYLKAENITHIHAAFADLPALFAAEAASRLKIGYSVSAHAVDVIRPKYSDKIIYGGATFVTLCNRMARAVLLERSPELADKVHVVPHGLRIDNWPWRRSPYKPVKPIRLLFVGRMVRKKRPDRAIAALRRLREAHYAASLCMVGDGPERAALEIEAKDLPVKWVSHVPRKLVRAAMENADALLVCSDERLTDDMEGIPNVMMEAMASGLPLILTPSGSMLDVVDKDTCFMVDFDDPEQIIKAVRLLLKAPDSVHQSLRSARRRIVEDFDANVLIEHRIALLRAQP